MSFSFGGKIASGGANETGLPSLLDYYDISNRNCYTIGSITASNLTNQRFNRPSEFLTLVGPATYNSSFGGNITTNGSNGYLQLDTQYGSYGEAGATGLTLEILYTPLTFDTNTSFPGEKYNYIFNATALAFRYSLDNSGDEIQMFDPTLGTGDPNASINIVVNHSINKNYLLTYVTYNSIGNQIHKIYINGNLVITSVNNLLLSGLLDICDIGRDFNARFYNTKIYLSPLSDIDVQTNYNFYKSKFGL